MTRGNYGRLHSSWRFLLVQVRTIIKVKEKELDINNQKI